jgi:uncharacterized membrane protein YuzA (DUF378 family)
MPTSQLIIWIVTIGVVSYDIVAALMGWSTISAQVRVVDANTSGLFRWMLVGLWLHFFVQNHWPK